MIKSITLVIVANMTGTQDDSFERAFDDLRSSPFCPTEGPFEGCIVIPRKGCRFPSIELGSGFSIKFAVSEAVCNGDNLRVTMTQPLMSRDKVEHPSLSLRSIVEILTNNGWRCPRFAEA